MRPEPMWFQRHLRGADIDLNSAGMRNFKANGTALRRDYLIGVDGDVERREFRGLKPGELARNGVTGG